MCTNNSILVLGEAGYGKTTLLAKSFLNHVDLLNVKLDYNMPFYIWLKGKKQSYHFSFKDYVSECFEEYLNKANYPFISLDNISPYFYMDGFDELTEKLSNAEINDIASSGMFKYPTLLTCRRQYANRYISNSIFSNKFNVIICVKEWDEDQADKYIENFCEKQGKNEEYKKKISVLLSDNKDLKSILNNPLLITMLLWVIETKRMVIPETIHSRVELFKECLNEMAKRELSRVEITSVEYEDLVLEWSYFAWEVYHQKLNNSPTMIRNCLHFLECSGICFIEYEKFASSIQAIFDVVGDTVYGTYHEQFLEFLVANALHDACIKKQYPYPIFLQYILRPEINRYFRALWSESDEKEKDTIATNLLEQYTENLFDDSNNSVSKRVHSIYHLSRFNLDKQAEKLKKAFDYEKHISVILSLYFGAIKMGDLDCEKRFYDLLMSDSDYNLANRGYHLAYYADSIIEGDLPYYDNERDPWNGTLSAFLRHFESSKINHFYLRRIDILTMQHLISVRGCTEPLTDNVMKYLEDLVYNPPFKQFTNFQKDIEKAFEDLKNKYNEINNP